MSAWWLLAFIVPPAIVLLGMVACGDLRITGKQQREFEARWESLTPYQRELQARLTHCLPEDFRYPDQTTYPDHNSLEKVT